MITLKKATGEAVKYACLHFHYAKRVPSAWYSYNVYNENKEWCGVIVYGNGAGPNIQAPFGMAIGEVVELVRVALNGKQPCTSECVAASLKQLHKDAPQVKLVVSYADSGQDHIGTIYQATNWIYLGVFAKGNALDYVINGKKYHNKTIHNKHLTEDAIRAIDPNYKKLGSAGKYKYIWVYDKRLRKQWQARALPYPKRGD